MSRKTTVGIAAVAALVCAAGAFYWLRARADRPVPEVVRPEPPGFHDALVPEKPPTPSKAKSRLPAGTNKTPPPVDTALPLRSGEVLEYTANVSSLQDVATLRLQVAGRGNFLGKSTWHLQAFAHTQNALRMVFELDDQFDSYSDAASLVSLQYEMHLSERGQKVESVQRMTATGKEPASPDAAEARVLPGTRDPLGIIQYLRNVDCTKMSQDRSPVYDGHKLYDVRAKITSASAKVTVPAGTYTASKIFIRVLDNGVAIQDHYFVVHFVNKA